MSQLIRGFNSALSKVGDVLSQSMQFNAATLSGAVDIIVVETPALNQQFAHLATGASSADGGEDDEDELHTPRSTISNSSTGSNTQPAIDGDAESLTCTPFHVRFGKLQLLRSREKLVTLSVNGVEMPFFMKLEKDGEAYFILPTTAPLPADRELMASPLVSPQVSPEPGAVPSTRNGKLPELDLTSPGSGVHPPASPPASGDAVVAAIRAAHIPPQQGKQILQQASNARAAELPAGHSSRSSLDHQQQMLSPQAGGISGDGSSSSQRSGKKSWMRSIFSMFSANQQQQAARDTAQSVNQALQSPANVRAERQAVSAEGEVRAHALYDEMNAAKEAVNSNNPTSLPPAHPRSTMISSALSSARSPRTQEEGREPEEEEYSASPTPRAKFQVQVEAPPLELAKEDEILLTDISHPRNASATVDYSSTASNSGSSSSVVSPTAKDLDQSTNGSSPTATSFDAWPAALGPFSYTPLPTASSVPLTTESEGVGAAPPLRLSLCGPLLSTTDGVHNERVFRENQVSYQAFNQHPSIHTHPHLVVLHPESKLLYPAKLALPLLLGQLAFDKPLALSNAAAQQLSQSDASSPSPVASPLLQPHNTSSTLPLPPIHATHRSAVSEPLIESSRVGWRDWFRGKRGVQVHASHDGDSVVSPSGSNSITHSRAQSPSFSSTNTASLSSSPRSNAASPLHSSLHPPTASSPTSASSHKRSATVTDIFQNPSGMWLRKTKRPNVSQLKQMNLKPGRNKISFCVNSSLQGKQYVECSVFLLKSTTRLIVSDIDGTITKSDLMGTLMPLLGRDWSHSGVAKLYTNIARNGFQIVYLTSRAIGQANITRSYIRGLKQDGLFLPDGPILMSPDRLIASFRREVVNREPQIFKIMSLTQLKHLFPVNHQCFYAGFGNRITDVLAYKAVGIPLPKIFIINPAGNIQSINNAYVKTYEQLNEIVDFIFPARDAFAAERNNLTTTALLEEKHRVENDPEQILHKLNEAERELNISEAASASSTPAAETTPTIAPELAAKLPVSTDADVAFNSYSFWRNEIAPLPLPKSQPAQANESEEETSSEEEEEEEREEDEDESEDETQPVPIAEQTKQLAAELAAQEADVNPVEFAARVQKQVEKGSAEAEAQAAVAEALVSNEEQKEIRKQ